MIVTHHGVTPKSRMSDFSRTSFCGETLLYVHSFRRHVLTWTGDFLWAVGHKVSPVYPRLGNWIEIIISRLRRSISDRYVIFGDGCIVIDFIYITMTKCLISIFTRIGYSIFQIDWKKRAIWKLNGNKNNSRNRYRKWKNKNSWKKL